MIVIGLSITYSLEFSSKKVPESKNKKKIAAFDIHETNYIVANPCTISRSHA